MRRTQSVVIAVFLVALLCTPAYSFNWWNRKNNKDVESIGGGDTCMECTLLVGLLQQLSVVQKKPIKTIVDGICTYFPSQFDGICKFLVNAYGAQVISMAQAGEQPDAICLKLGKCTEPKCVLFPEKIDIYRDPNEPVSALEHGPIKLNLAAHVLSSNVLDGAKEVKGGPFDWLQQLINRFANNHQPFEDVDGDRFSIEETLRGWSWRGRDCDDAMKEVHPGSNKKSVLTIDWNCNGIKGFDNAALKSYEELFCGQSQPMGVVVVGDSAGAHFEIPPSYLNASEINNTTYNNLLYVLENEGDWPERSQYTGFQKNSSEVMIDSIYLRLRQRNLCNHRDYQNLGVNGARSGDMAAFITQDLARNQSLDHPIMLLMEVIGNDVCNGHPDYESRMTTPAQFEANILAALRELDKKAPKGSHVLFSGLADGRALWDNLYNRTHPVGVTYQQIYDYLNCLQISPCLVWMNSNETIRNAGSTRAAELSQVYSKIIANNTFKNFDMAYYEFPFKQISQEWIARGGQVWQLIEPIDGFHPNQIANALSAETLWNNLLKDHPTWLGPVNSYNAAITKMFGDQGGY